MILKPLGGTRTALGCLEAQVCCGGPGSPPPPPGPQVLPGASEHLRCLCSSGSALSPAGLGVTAPWGTAQPGARSPSPLRPVLLVSHRPNPTGSRRPGRYGRGRQGGAEGGLGVKG